MGETSEQRPGARVVVIGKAPDAAAQPKERYATRLFDLRILSDESQREVAAAVGVAGPTYGAWERGDRDIKAEKLVALARHFHVTPNEILDFGETALQIPRLDPRREELLKRFDNADPKSQNMAFEILEYGSKARRPR